MEICFNVHALFELPDVSLEVVVSKRVFVYCIVCYCCLADLVLRKPTVSGDAEVADAVFPVSDSAANTSSPPPQAWPTPSSSLPPSLAVSSNNYTTTTNTIANTSQHYHPSSATTSPLIASCKQSPASSTSSPYTSPGYSGEDHHRRSHRTTSTTEGGYPSPARRSSFGGFQAEDQSLPPFSANSINASLHQALGTSGQGRRPLTGEEVQCTVCGRMLCNKYVLKVHMRDMHRPRSVHQCPHCNRCYSTINSLRVHVSTMHNKPNNQLVASGTSGNSAMVSPIQLRHLQQQQQQSHTVGVAPPVGPEQQQQQFFPNREICYQQQPYRPVVNSNVSGGMQQQQQQQLLTPKNEFGVSDPPHST